MEGRAPLKPLVDIREQIGNPPAEEKIICHTIRYQQEIVGCTWTLGKPAEYYYVLHFYIKNSHKRKGIGKEAIAMLDSYYRNKNIQRSELMFSGSNYLGLKFLTDIGYDKIIYVEAPAENTPTSSIELELSRSFC